MSTHRRIDAMTESHGEVLPAAERAGQIPRIVDILRGIERFAPGVKPRRVIMSSTVAAVLLTASSCVIPQQLRSKVVDETTPEATHAHYSVSSDETDKAAVAQSPESASAADSGIQQLSYESRTASPSSPPSKGAVEEWPALPPGQVHPFAPPTPAAQDGSSTGLMPASFPAEPRIALPRESLSLKNCPLPWEQCREIPAPVCEPEVFADEYLCDGGDRGLPIHYHGVERAGLETEDTVAEFTDHTGETHVKPSSRVCIYAPQFASVRSASAPEMSLAVGRAAGAHDGRTQAGLKTKLSPEVELQNDQSVGLDIRSRASGLDTDAAVDSFAQIAEAVHHVKLVNLFEDRSFFQRAQLDQSQEAYLAYGLQAAREWTRDRNPVIVASDAAGQEVIARFKVEEYSAAEDQRTPGDLKIIKLADVHVAHPGDVVTFTIHYDNVGGRELRRVRIIDNLTPRLEYLEGSASSDRDGRLDVEENDEGSLVLIFELAEPLPGESGGTVTFQARVR